MKVIPKHNLDVSADFFYKFARFEYALKACGYVKNSKYVQPDWDKFAKDMLEVFEKPSTEQLSRAINYYLTKPPQKQIFVDGHLTWTESRVEAGSTARKVLTYVRRVRNNLFHGGKFKGRYLEKPQRSEELMRHAMIMDACLLFNEDLRTAYNE